MKLFRMLHKETSADDEHSTLYDLRKALQHADLNQVIQAETLWTDLTFATYTLIRISSRIKACPSSCTGRSPAHRKGAHVGKMVPNSS